MAENNLVQLDLCDIAYMMSLYRAESIRQSFLTTFRQLGKNPIRKEEPKLVAETANNQTWKCWVKTLQESKPYGF